MTLATKHLVCVGDKVGGNFFAFCIIVSYLIA